MFRLFQQEGIFFLHGSYLGECPPLIICIGGIAQIMMGKFLLPTVEVKPAGKFICKSLVLHEFIFMGESCSFIILFARAAKVTLYARQFGIHQRDLMIAVGWRELAPFDQLFLIGSYLF